MGLTVEQLVEIYQQILALPAEEAVALIEGANRMLRDERVTDDDPRVVMYRVASWREQEPNCAACGTAFERQPNLYLSGEAVCSIECLNQLAERYAVEEELEESEAIQGAWE